MAEILPLTRDPQDRLRAALRLLAAAQSAQREALAAFRSSLDDLRDSTARLQGSAQGWQRQVGAAGQRIGEAREAVRRLEATAARM